MYFEELKKYADVQVHEVTSNWLSRNPAERQVSKPLKLRQRTKEDFAFTQRKPKKYGYFSSSTATAPFALIQTMLTLEIQRTILKTSIFPSKSASALKTARKTKRR